jgi:phenylpropionate dioxygenase-like ring-hydroxylating dioxygenase large terminal subunit
MTETAIDSNAPWLRNCWYQAAWLQELSQAPFLVRTILNQTILLFRDASGSLCAILDRCPHRFAPLSAGEFRDGLVRCGYHGLTFDGRGHCVNNPHGTITSAMRVPAFPVLERHQAAWIWMGEEEPDESLLPSLSFIDNTPDTARSFGYMATHANYQLLTDNIMDLSHADYLHPHSLGGMMTNAQTTMKEERGEFWIEWLANDCAPPPAYYSLVPPPTRADIWIQVRWHAPALMVLGTGADVAGSGRDPAQEALNLHNMTPETLSSTHYFFCATRKFQVEDAAFNRELTALVSQAFNNEDKPMLEKQQARMGTADLWSLSPVLLNIDAGAVKVRRLLSKMIEAEKAALRRRTIS